MMAAADLRFVPFSDDQADELVAMWRASFERAVGIVDPHSIAAQKRYFLTEILANYEVQVALAGDQVVRFIAASAESIAQLYIHTDFQDRDIGSHMRQWAKDRSAGQPWLYTFARNTGARRFYEDRGFRIAVRGFEETWGLEDIRYEWKRTGQEEGS